LVLLCSVGAGCRAEVDAIFYTSDGQVPAETITKACQIWFPVGLQCELGVDGNTNVAITGYRHAAYAGETDPWHGEPIRVRIDLDYTNGAAYVAHEFGHCLGLIHDNSGPALMNASITDEAVLTDIDKKQYYDLHPGAPKF